MIGLLPTNAEQLKKLASSYNPSQEVKDLTDKIRQDYQIGYDINHRPFVEFNDMSLIERMNVDQKAFNAYVYPKSEDPEESWRWNGVRPTTMNKVLLTCAHLVSGMMYPGFFAQNDQDEEDKEMAYIMDDLMEWNIKHSDYELTFLYGVLAALINPVAYVHVDYTEVLQTIKVKNESGEYTKQQIVDEVLSGLQFHNIPADEIMITNAYQYHLQKQRAIIRRRWIDYDEAKARHGNHENFEYVWPGVKVLYNKDDSMFYDQVDDEVSTMCEEVTYYNRREDLEVVFVNGVYMGDSDVNANRMTHRDNKNRPKYPYIKFGAEPIDEKRFYFYKSMTAKLANDQEIGDQWWRTLMDGSLLEVMAPIATIGALDVDSNFNYPGAQIELPAEASVQTIGTGRNLGVGWTALQQIESSMSSTAKGSDRAPDVSADTAYQASLVEKNAKISLGIIGVMIVKMVREIGSLASDNIIKYQTIGVLENVIGETQKMKYRNFLLPDKESKGKKITEKIMFDAELDNMKMPKNKKAQKEWKIQQGFKIRDEEGESTKIYRVNPIKFANLSFFAIVDPESWIPKNERFEELMSLEKYDRLVANPLIAGDPEAMINVTRDFLLRATVKGDTDKYLPKDKEKIAQQFMNNQQTPGQIPSSPKGPLKRPNLEAIMRE